MVDPPLKEGVAVTQIAEGEGVWQVHTDSVDMTPTILDLAGLNVPEVMQGDSMAAWCLGGEGPRNEVVYLGLGRPERAWRAVWDGRYVYSPLGYEVLYDHQEDPHEMDNRFDDDGFGDVRERLGKAMVKIAEETGDPLLDDLCAICK